MKDTKSYLLILHLLGLLTSISVAQIPDFSKVDYPYPGDSVNIIHLINNGIQMNKGKVIVWFPKDSLSEDRMSGILDTLQMGITAAEKYIHAPRSWQVQQKESPYTYYFRTDRFISHASHAGFVSIPFWRIKHNKAPWLHEALHEMLNTKARHSVSEKEFEEYEPHVWLHEGLADYIAMQISQQYNLPRFDPLANGIVLNVDSICKTDLISERRAYILSFVGRKGVMPELFSPKRMLYAPPFYHCSCSFIKYLVKQQGLEPLLNSISASPREHEALQKLIRPSLDVLKSAWMKELKLNE